ncbi:hypothetical protein ACWFMI_27505 [Nocardiopsis terrae]
MSVTVVLVIGAATSAANVALLVAREAGKSWAVSLLISGGALFGAVTALSNLAGLL